MTREEHRDEILKITNHNILAELATGVGKSKIALDIINSKDIKKGKMLIVVPRNVLKDNWTNEIAKWWSNCNLEITYTTYVSLPKYAGKWDAVIFDECHHLSERCREALTAFNIKYSVLLSATVGYNLKDELKEIFDNLYIYKVSARKAIDDNILPDPIVYLIPMKLKTGIPTESMIINPKAKKECKNGFPFTSYWTCKRQKEYKCIVYCNEDQYYDCMDNEIEYYKRKSSTPAMRNIWLHKCGERLKWLSDKKNTIVKQILDKLNNNRTLVFCNSIEQTELLGNYCINSKNKDSVDVLNKFNNHSINHITACNMLNEGMNLVDCQVGIYANLNSSGTIVKQRLGRILRHKNPIIIIPYYKDTRDEELVNIMIQDYNPELVKVIKSIDDIKV